MFGIVYNSPMRRKDREVKNVADILEIIAGAKVCRLGLAVDSSPYVVPMNFGYTYENGILTLYFHAAATGKKMDMLRQNNAVCFEMEGAGNLKVGEKDCQYGYRFQSVIGYGKAVFITDEREKREALSAIMAHQTGEQRVFLFGEKEVAAVTIFKITADSFTGKAS